MFLNRVGREAVGQKRSRHCELQQLVQSRCDCDKTVHAEKSVERRLVEHMKEEDIASAVIVVKNKISNYARQVEARRCNHS